ncbi:hypothetical protein P4H27_27585 [Paenibacillus taichungensis]|uniref:hypothetical protein n=1 Tax=Paenibacillus taichungensis TaxID=484184 RepID=UPI002DBB0C07|nr:hypothetical protein [Paenibacillus taichungensis]MEC0110727.1 hypothetical protein [Paenibacillus taichungensis]MEC0197945.1 hypothetical protein [Paenibacillus taichungensis]
MKKILISSLMVSSLFLGSGVASISAQSGEFETQQIRDLTVIESSQIFDDTTLLSGKSTIIPVKGVDKETGEITNRGAYTQSLLKFFNSDPQKYAGSIIDIDAIVESATLAASQSIANKSNGEISPSAIVGQGWSKAPVITSSKDLITYSTSWITEDNYRSSVPITATYTKTLTTSVSLGFTGANVIKDKMGFNATFNETQTSTIAQGATVPGWTVWGTRPYIKWTEENWTGTYYYIDSTGGIVQVIEGPVSGTNKKLRTKSNEYWSRENTSKSTSATTPAPPTGVPNA